MTHGCEELVQGINGGGHSPQEGSGKADRIILVSGTVPGLDELRNWVVNQERLVLLQHSASGTWRTFDESGVVLRIIDSRFGYSPRDRAPSALDFDGPTLLVLAETANVDLARIPPRRNLDVLRQPYDAVELIWRVQRAVRSTGDREPSATERLKLPVVCGPLSFDPIGLEVLVFGHSLPLRRAEREILVYLMQNAGRFVSTRELQERVLGTCGSGSAARNQVYEVRSKLRALGLPEAIVHKPREGYRLSWSG